MKAHVKIVMTPKDVVTDTTYTPTFDAADGLITLGSVVNEIEQSLKPLVGQRGIKEIVVDLDLDLET